MRPEKRLFAYSILYLFVMFGALVVDRLVDDAIATTDPRRQRAARRDGAAARRVRRPVFAIDRKIRRDAMSRKLRTALLPLGVCS